MYVSRGMTVYELISLALYIGKRWASVDENSAKEDGSK
jgi:hypothetical protein